MKRSRSGASARGPVRRPRSRPQRTPEVRPTDAITLPSPAILREHGSRRSASATMTPVVAYDDAGGSERCTARLDAARDPGQPAALLDGGIDARFAGDLEQGAGAPVDAGVTMLVREHFRPSSSSAPTRSKPLAVATRATSCCSMRRAAERFRGEEWSRSILDAGHIPGAVSLPPGFTARPRDRVLPAGRGAAQARFAAVGAGEVCHASSRAAPGVSACALLLAQRGGGAWRRLRIRGLVLRLELRPSHAASRPPRRARTLAAAASARPEPVDPRRGLRPRAHPESGPDACSDQPHPFARMRVRPGVDAKRRRGRAVRPPAAASSTSPRPGIVKPLPATPCRSCCVRRAPRARDARPRAGSAPRCGRRADPR